MRLTQSVIFKFIVISGFLSLLCVVSVLHNHSLKQQIKELEVKLDAKPIYKKPTKLQLQALQTEITTILGKEKDNYAVVIKGLKSGNQVAVNPSLVLPPASVSKLPYAILLLRDVQSNKISLENNIPIHTFTRAYPSDPLYNASSAQTFRTILEYLTHASDYCNDDTEAILWRTG